MVHFVPWLYAHVARELWGIFDVLWKGLDRMLAELESLPWSGEDEDDRDETGSVECVQV
jgi:hypothetical protein